MTHARQQIRESAVTLITGLSTTGTNVHDSRQFELEQTDLPAWIVYTSDEEEEAELSHMGGNLARTLTLSFAGIARSLTGLALQQTLDAMAEELETVVTKNAITGAELIYSGTEWDFDIEETDQALGRMTVSYACRYYTDQGAPGVLT